MNNFLKFLLIGLIALLILLFHFLGLAQYLSLDYIQGQKASLLTFYAENQLQMLVLFFSVYVLSTALSLPGASILSLVAGALFGLKTGLILVSFASTIGATLAFMSSRFLFRDYVENKFQRFLGPINKGLEQDGLIYLFGLRLIPVIPFFVINLVMGLTKMRVHQYFLVSQVGMLPGTVVYINAGLQLGTLESLSDILSVKIIGSFVLLAFFPFLAKKVLKLLKN